MPRVLAIDPGKVSGWAFMDTDDPSGFVCGQLPMMEALDVVERVFRFNRVDVAVCEAYTITARSLKVSRGENWSLESNGVVRWLARNHGVEFVLQAPADGKGFGTDEKLRALGMYTPTEGGHANDAARHLITYAARIGCWDAVSSAREEHGSR